MKHINPFIIIPFTILLFYSCSHKLVGTWNIHQYETVVPNETGTTLTNNGTITFHKNGNGEKNISYSVFGKLKTDNNIFSWKSDRSFLTIESQQSELSKTWIVIVNKNKIQKWKSTDGSSEVQIMELHKLVK